MKLSDVSERTDQPVPAATSPPSLGTHVLRGGAIAALSIAAGLIGISSIGYHHGDETNYIEVAMRMRETGNYLVPIFHGELILDRALLFYWILVASFDVLGVSTFAARLPSVLAAGLLTAMVYGFSWNTYRDVRGAVYAALATASLPVTCAVTRLALPDAVMTVGIFLSVIAYARATGSKRHRPSWLFVASVALGIAGMAKGHVGIVVSSVPLAVLILLTDRGALRWRDLALPTTWAPALLLWGWWYAYLLFSDRRVVDFGANAPNAAFTLGDALIRFLTAEAEHQITPGFLGLLRNVRDYAFGMVAWFVPWSVYVVGGFFFGRRYLRTEWRERRRETTILLTWIASITALFAFFILEVQQYRYVLPTVPAFGILTARFFRRRETESTTPQPRLTRPLVLGVTLTLFWGLVFGIAIPWAVRPPIENLARELRPRLGPDDVVFASGIGGKWMTFAAVGLGRRVTPLVEREGETTVEQDAERLRTQVAKSRGAIYALLPEQRAAALHASDPLHFEEVASGRGSWVTQRFGLWDELAVVRVRD